MPSPPTVLTTLTTLQNQKTTTVASHSKMEPADMKKQCKIHRKKTKKVEGDKEKAEKCTHSVTVMEHWL